MRTTIELGPDDRLLVVRRSDGPTDATYLAREVAVLERLDHPAILAPVSVERAGADDLTVATPYVGASVADRTLPGPAIAALFAEVADALVHAHDRGVVHGALAGEHVLVTADGAPVVCGWGAVADGAGPTDDVVALGRLLGDVVDADEQAPVSLAALAARAAEAGRSAGPTMASLAHGLRALADADRPRGRRLTPRTSPDPSLPPGSGPTAPPGPRPRRAVRLGTAAVVLGVVAGAALGLTGRQHAGEPAGSRAERPASGAADDGRPAPPAWEPVDATCVPTGGPTDGPSASGRCQRPTIDRGVVSVGGARWAVGADDDLVVLGHWDCADLPTPAVVRPGTGEVWVFPRWATSTTEVEGRAVAVLGAAADAVSLDGDADGCHEIGVVRPDGTRVVVDPRTDRA